MKQVGPVISMREYRDFNRCCKRIAVVCWLWLISSGQVQALEPGSEIITGAGAHFAWTIFDDLKSDLEKVVGKKIVVFGKDSMLGQGCNAGVKMAKQYTEKNPTFGFLCCPLSAEEQKKEDLVIYPLAMEPIVIMVNELNSVRNLTLDQVRAIFRGDIRNWREVGGKDQAIVVVTRLHCKDRPGHWKTILPDKKYFRQERLNVQSSDEMVARITDFEGAIGHTGSTWVRQPGLKVQPVSVDGVAATAENLRNKSYPFYRPLSAVTVQQPSADVLKLIREVQVGPAFRAVAKHYELLPLNRLEQR